jgi:glycosyltransferase involved in cell wall biosynthesis
MTNKPHISIIIPFFNAEKFIGDAIESVLAQTNEQWELLLVDDGSTDGSTELALQYAKDHPQKVRYLQHENHRNRGACASRNLGVIESRGEFIALLDADDVWFPRKLEQQAALLASHPDAGMVYGPSRYWFSWTGNGEESRRDYVRNLGVQPDTLIEPPTLLTLALQSKAPTPCPSNILVRRRVIDRVGGFEEQFRGIYQLYEDQAFLAKVCLNHAVFVSSECWDKYRQHPDSCVAVVTRSGQKYTAGLVYLRWLERYLSECAINDDDLWKALRSKQFRYRFPNFNRLLNRTRHRFLQTKEFIGQMGRRAVR